MLNWKDVYRRCKDINICANQYDFSESVLGLGRSTFSASISEGRDVSLSALTRSFFRLEEVLNETEKAAIDATGDERNGYDEGVKELNSILDDIWAEMHARATCDV